MIARIGTNVSSAHIASVPWFGTVTVEAPNHMQAPKMLVRKRPWFVLIGILGPSIISGSLDMDVFRAA